LHASCQLSGFSREDLSVVPEGFSFRENGIAYGIAVATSSF